MRTHFDSSEQGALLLAARTFVAEASLGREEAGTALPEELAREMVFGVFTTLRRGGMLRSCIGHWPLQEEGLDRLGNLLRRSASHAASHDTRFPSIHPAELGLLELELSVLFPPRLITGGPEQRLAAVEPGRHGLILKHRGSQGVLLPQVAAERGWDAEMFLNQVSQKAGLSSRAWREPGAVLKVFEALHFGDAAPRRELSLKQISSGLARQVDQALRCPGEPLPALEDSGFEFWTGVLVETSTGTDYWLRERGNLALLVEEGLRRDSIRGKGERIRRLFLLSHALPLKAGEDPARRHHLAGSAVWIRSEQGARNCLRASGSRGDDPVPEALRGAELSRSRWFAGEAEVMAMVLTPAAGAGG